MTEKKQNNGELFFIWLVIAGLFGCICHGILVERYLGKTIKELEQRIIAWEKK